MVPRLRSRPRLMIHVDGYVLDLDNQLSRTRHYRWDSPGLPIRSEYTRAPYWQGDMYFTAPHEDGHCDEYLPDLPLA